ncbi:hypothetical protein B0H14DRAFT_3551027 [Mycena olivaceomarginata]|nr:hypothetical protein B0H14DRAFT_3551027 [Mycena olivaceomarginata]
MHRPAAEPVPWRAAQRTQCFVRARGRVADGEHRGAQVPLMNSTSRSSSSFRRRQVRVERPRRDALVRRRYQFLLLTSPLPDLHPPPQPQLPHRRVGHNPPRPAVQLPLPHACQCCTTPTPTPRPRRRAPEAFAVLLTRHSRSFGRTLSQCRRTPTPPFVTHPHHSVTFPVSPHRYASSPTSAPTPTRYTSTLASPTQARDAAHGAESVVPVCPCAYVAGAREGTRDPSLVRGGTRCSPVKGLGVFSVLLSSPPLHRTPCPITRATCHRSFPWMGRRKGEGEDDEDAWTDVDEDVEGEEMGRGRTTMGKAGG